METYPIRVGYGVESPTHHVSLSDGSSTIGLIIVDANGNARSNAISRAPVPRTALKTSSGESKYSDFEPPWTPLSQDDWGGGRGYTDFERDVTRYYDGYRANTMAGTITPGPQEVYSVGHRKEKSSYPGSISWLSLLTGSQKYVAVKVIPDNNFTTSAIWLHVKRVGTPKDCITVEFCSDTAGSPGTVIDTITATTTDINDTISVFHRFATAQSVSASTPYWVKVYSASGDTKNHWKVGVSETAGTTKESSDNTTWSDSTIDIYYRITDTDVTYTPYFLLYKYALYLFLSGASGAPKMYINGDRGTADSNSGALTTLVDATKTWTTNQWAGCMAVITGGKGMDEPVRYRTIVSNTDTTLTLDSAWTIEHDTTTEYIIQGSNTWTEITGHGLTGPLSSRPLVCNNFIYVPMGDSINIRRMRFYTDSGVWTAQYADDGTNKASYLVTVRDSTNGLEVWRANNSDTSGAISVSKATPVTTWADMTFGTAIAFTDSFGKINGLAEYGDTSKQLWVFREDTIFTISDNSPDEIPLPEMRTVADIGINRASMKQGVYLFFTLGSGIERYYSRTLDDVGFNRDDGLPSDRQGNVSSLQTYPGKYFAANDAGASGYSTIMAYNGTGWCELYRAPTKGYRILDMCFQPLPGATLDRLWFTCGPDVLWLGFPSNTLDPTKDSNYRYTHEAVLTSGYMYAGLYDIYKFYNSLKVFAENMIENAQTIEAEYRVDNDTEWIPLPDVFDTSPMQEILLKETYGVTGKRLQYRLHLLTNDNSKTSIVKGAVLECVSRVPVKYSFTFPFRLRDYDIDLNGNRESTKAKDKYDLIDSWAATLTPLLMRCNDQRFDNITVFIDPTPSRSDREHSESYIDTLTTVQI